MTVDPPKRRGHREAGRMAVPGIRTSDGSWNSLVVVHENDGRWTVHGLGAAGVTITEEDAIGIAQGIIAATEWTR